MIGTTVNDGFPRESGKSVLTCCLHMLIIAEKQEITPLLRSGDFFQKIVVTGGSSRPAMGENGIIYTGIIPFLLNPDSLDSL